MTTEEFLKFVRDNSQKGDWVVTCLGRIRHSQTYECPICWVGTMTGRNPLGLKGSYWSVPLGLGGEADAIASSADCSVGTYRRELENSCHLA